MQNQKELKRNFTLCNDHLTLEIKYINNSCCFFLFFQKQREKSLSLPTVVAKSMMEKEQTDSQQIRKSREPSKIVLTQGKILPPIKLGQLINI